jgi:hypothetical protein
MSFRYFTETGTVASQLCYFDVPRSRVTGQDPGGNHQYDVAVAVEIHINVLAAVFTTYDGNVRSAPGDNERIRYAVSVSVGLGQVEIEKIESHLGISNTVKSVTEIACFHLANPRIALFNCESTRTRV